MPTNKWYGWRPDKPDFRDRRFAVRAMAPADLPPAIDLRANMPPVYNQGDLGSCTANAIGGALEYIMKREGRDSFTPSRLFIYYEERVLEDAIKEDAGAEIRDGIKVIASLGAPHEGLWPYDVSKFAVKPSPEAYTDALKDLIGSYRRVYNNNLNSIKTPLAKGHPVVFGFTVYDGFESDETAKTGILSMPQPQGQALGGHAVVAVGYDDATERLIVRNSWGADWGDKGYFYMPYDYAVDEDLATDFWSLETIV